MVKQRTINIYQFDAQEKVISDNYDINVYEDWYNFLHEQFKEDLNKIGVDCEGFYWDIERGNYIYMNNPKIIDEEKFINSIYSDKEIKARTSLKELQDKEDNNFWIEIATHNENNYIRVNSYGNYETEHNFEDKYNEHIQDILKGFKKQIKENYEYLTSEESIKETIKINEYEFLENGDMA